MAVTRIKNNQITDLTVNAAAKLQDFSVTSAKIANNLTYGSDLTIQGNLTVQGNVTAIETHDLIVEDPLILLAKDQTGTPSLDIGYIGERGDEENIAFVWDESNTKFVTAFTASATTNTTITISSYADFETNDLTANNASITGTITVTGNTTVGNIFVDGQKTIDVGNSIIGNVQEPVANTDAATKGYVDSVTSSGFTIEDDTANTTVISGGDTLELLGTANEVVVAITAADQVTFGLPANVTIADSLTVTNNANAATLNASGNVTAGNAVITNDVSAATGTFSGNVTAGNISTAGALEVASISATGNITGGNLISNADVTTVTVTASGNVNGGNVNATNTVTALTIDATTVTASGNVEANIVVATGNIEANNAVITNDVSAATGTFSGNVTAGNISTSGSLSVDSISATGNITGGNLNSNASVTGTNITASETVAANNVSVTNNIDTTTIDASGNIVGANINANSSVTGTNITASETVAANNISVTNNIGTVTLDASGNIVGANINANSSVTGTTFVASGNIDGANLNATTNITGITVTASGNVDAAGVSATGNVSGGNLIASGNVIASGAEFGNLSVSGNLDLDILNANTVVVSGETTSNTFVALAQVDTPVVTNDSGNVTITTTTSGNIVLDPVGGVYLADENPTSVLFLDSAGAVDTSVDLTYSSNVFAVNGNLTAGNAAVSGQITADSVETSNNIVAGGNVSAAYVIANNITNSSGPLTITTTSGDLVLSLSGNLDLASRWINDLASPVMAHDAATKQYVDDAVSSGITIHTPVRLESNTAVNGTYAQGGTTATVTDTVAGNTVVFSAAIDPQVNDQLWFSNSFNGVVANLAYFVVSAPNTSAAVLSTAYNGVPVSNITSGSGLTESVRINSGQGATLTNAGANATLTIDGVTTVNGDRILIYSQSNAAENGVYVVTEAGNATTAWVMTRSSDMDTYIPDDIDGFDAGDYFYVQEGNTGAGESYVLTAPVGPVIIGYDPVTFTQFGASQVYSANTQAGLVLNGTIFSAKVDNDTTAFDVGGNISVKAGANLVTPNIGAATGTSLTLTGNVSADYISATGNVAASGNLNANNAVVTNGVEAATVTATGNIDGGNVNATTNVTSTTITASGNIEANNVIATTTLSAGGNVEANNAVITNDVAATTGSFSGNVTAGNISTAGTFDVASITASGNITGGNLISNADVTTVTVTASGNIDGGNVNSSAAVTGVTVAASGNITANNAVITNDVSATTGTFSGNVTAWAVTIDTLDANLVLAGNVDAGNISAVYDITANAIYTNVFDAISTVTANIITANSSIVSNDTIVASGNLSAANITATHSITGNSSVILGNLDAGNVNVTNDVSAVNILASGNVDAGDFVNANAAVFLGNVDAGNVNATEAITAALAVITGNIDAGNAVIVGDISAATGTFSGAVSVGNLDAGNVNATEAITAALAVITGNIDAGNAVIAGDVSATTGTFSGNVSGANINATTGVTAVTITASGNVDGGNINSAAAVTGVTITASGNVDGGNINSAAAVTGVTVVASGNVEANNVVVTNSVEAATVTATGNIQGGNIATAGQADLGNIVISGDNITGTNGVVAFNTAGADVDVRVSGDTVANLLVADAGTDTVLIGTGDPTVGAALKVGTTDSILMPVGNTAQRPGTPATGMIRFNTTEDTVEYYDSDSWVNVASDFTVIVDNQFSGNGVQTEFTLTSNSTTAAVIVSINGVLQIPTTAYSVSGNVLAFTEAPESTDVIDVRILTTTRTVTVLQNVSGNAKIETTDTSADLFVTGNLLPAANVTYNLGNATARWNELYLAGNTIALGDVVIKNTGGNTIGFFGPDGTTPGTIDTNNIDSAAISNGNSNVAVVASGGNVNVNIGGNLVTEFGANGFAMPGSIFLGNIILKELGGNLRVRNAEDTADAVVEATFLATSVSTGNLQLGDNHIESTNLNGEINLRPNGTGNVELESATIQLGKADANVQITSKGTGNLVFAIAASNVIAITSGGIENMLANGVGNIGSETSTFNTVFAKATSAQYADLAEMYCADADYPPGTVLSFGGTQEVTISAVASDARVAGVVSTNPAHLMNSTLDCDCAVVLALTGRVPTLVTGPVRKGDMMVSAGNGHAQACAAPSMGTVIGKALENFDGESGTIEIVVGRL